MRILVIGGGQVGTTIVDSLHDEHDVTVVDVEPTLNLSPGAVAFGVPQVGQTAEKRVIIRGATIAVDSQDVRVVP